MIRFAKKLFFRSTFLATMVSALLVYYYSRQNVVVSNLDPVNQFIKPNMTSIINSEKLTNIAKNIPITYSLERCPVVNENRLNVHFIMHTHNDPGWLKTAEQYYHQDVRQILFSVVDELKKDRKRKFVYSEMYFFKRWWNEINETMKTIIKDFVVNGQLEFVGGGWVQNDDALTHYSAMIDQMTYGLNEIRNIFGLKARPAVGWQIDSFGLSQEVAALFSQFGFEAEVLQRIPWYDIRKRRTDAEMEFIWKGDDRSKIFTHVLFDQYIAPPGFRYENDIDFLNQDNLLSKTNMFFETALLRSKSYKTNHLMVLMGHDFVYKTASIWFDNVDKLMTGGNSMDKNGTKINFVYSTPSCYFKMVRQRLQTSNFSVKTDDFFPYCDNSVSIWTGFYSSRPTLKGLLQKVASMIQTVQNLEAAVTSADTRNLLNAMRENFFTVLHHDAITGTCKQFVANDYILLLIKAENIGQRLLELIHSTLDENRLQNPPVGTTSSVFCPLLNISLCAFSQIEKQFSVTIFNGHSKGRLEYVSIPVDSTNFVVTDWKNNPSEFEVVEIIYDNQQLPKLQSANYNLIVSVQLPALGFTTVNVKQSGNQGKKISVSTANERKNYIENEFYKITFNSVTGLMVSVENKKLNKLLRVSQQFVWYENPTSGAYKLRPVTPHELNTVNVTLKKIEGLLVQEMWQKFDNWATQTVQLFKDKDYVEVEWTVGPIFGRLGKELSTRFFVDIANGGTFFTDANGRQFVKRKSVLPAPAEEPPFYPVGAAYYPVTSMIMIKDNVLKDNNTQFAIVTDRPMGGSSQFNGSVELMLHRKVMADDDAGMGEGLDEYGPDGRPIVVRGTYRFAFSSNDDSKLGNKWREFAKEMFYAPILKFSQMVADEKSLKQYTLLSGNLPDGVHLLSFQKFQEHYVLIRLENYFQDSIRTVSLEPIVKTEECKRTLLSGDIEQLSSSTSLNSSAITLEPLSIITLVCVV